MNTQRRYGVAKTLRMLIAVPIIVIAYVISLLDDAVDWVADRIIAWAEKD